MDYSNRRMHAQTGKKVYTSILLCGMILRYKECFDISMNIKVKVNFVKSYSKAFIACFELLILLSFYREAGHRGLVV